MVGVLEREHGSEWDNLNTDWSNWITTLRVSSVCKRYLSILSTILTNVFPETLSLSWLD